MKKVFLLTFLLSITISAETWGQQYNTNKNGAARFSQSLSNVTEFQKKSIQTVRNDQATSGNPQNASTEQKKASTIDERCSLQLKEAMNNCRQLFRHDFSTKIDKKTIKTSELIEIYNLCSYPLLQDKFTAEEKGILAKLSNQVEMALKELTQKELNTIELWVSSVYSSCEEKRSYSGKEIQELDSVLKNIWKQMNTALLQNNIEKASSYYVEDNQALWHKRFHDFTPEVRMKIAQDNLEALLHVGNIRRNRVIYDLIATENGQKYSYQLIFEKNRRGEWKIRSF